MFLVYVLFIVGLVAIVFGGDLFVDGASRIAKLSGIPSFVIGATIVSVATTLPEIIVSTMAAIDGSVDMAVGNAIGSVTANTGLIMALAVLFMAIPLNRSAFAKKGILFVATSAVLALLCIDGELRVFESVIMIAIFALFIVENVFAAKDAPAEEDEAPDRSGKALAVTIVKFLVGAAGIVIGSRLLVNNGTEIAVAWGVPERIIAITMVAIGTSLPELVTTLTAIIKKEPNLSVGNVIGANIIDTALILPLCSFISGGTLTVSHVNAVLDIPVSLGIAVLAIVPTLIQKKFMKWQGFAMLAAYIAYVACSCIFF